MSASTDHNGPRAAVLAYLEAAHQHNPQAETPAVELERELGLEPEIVFSCLERLAAEGLIDADLSLVNVWVRLAGSGPPGPTQRAGYGEV